VVRYLRFATLGACFLLVVALTTTMTSRPARASIPDPQLTAGTATLCTGYSGCARVGRGNAGYSSANNHMYWRMFSGHNCTNYAAYRMVHSGMANSRPWTGSGNATNWGVAMSRITNGTPAVGAIAWWRAYHRPAGSAGHVAYVERVVDSDTIIVSQDSWGGDFSWKQITRYGGQWPSGFVHFNDLRPSLRNTAQPSVTGTAKVGSTLTATPGSWSMSGVTTRYQWRANKVPVPGGSSRTLVLQAAQLGKKITMRVYASKSGQRTVSRASHATAPVAVGTLANVARPAIVGEPEVGQTLSADPGTWSPSGPAMTYSWRADGAILPGEDGATLQIGPELLGKVIGLRVMAEKTGYRKTGLLAARTTPVSQGTMTLSDPPAISGGTRPGQTLTLERVVPTPRDAKVSVQWLRDGVTVPRATRSTYVLSAADLGHRLTAQVSVSRHGYRRLVAKAAAPATVRSLPGLRTGMKVSQRTLRLNVTMAAPGVKVVNGVVGVRVAGRFVKTFRVQHSTGWTTLRVASGRQRVELHFRRTDLLEARDTSRIVQVP
jgi:surface antigen